MKTYWSSALISLILCGCALGPTYEQAAESSLIGFNYAAADRLLTQALPALDPGKPVVATTLVSIDDPNQSSRLGRLISEHMASRLTQSGMAVVATANHRGSILAPRAEGATILSREAQEFTASHSGQAVMLGTYARAGDYVYVTVKLVRSGDNLVVAAYNYVLPLDTNIEAMLPPR
jgi:TolB-like protein